MFNTKSILTKKGQALFVIPIYLITFFFIFYTLYIGKDLIIPFIIALLFSFAIIGLKNFYKKLKIPTVISFLLSLATYGFIFWLIGKIIDSNLDELLNLLPSYQTKIYSIYASIFEKYDIAQPQSITQIIQEINLSKALSITFGAITSIFSKGGIILIYTIFILLEFRFFGEKLNLMFSDEGNKKHIFDIINKIKKDIKSYFVIKTIVSFITAILSYIIMLAFGLDFAPFWAFVVFLLNYIPSIGSIIAVIFPVLFSLIQYDNYYMVLFLTLCLSGVQILMGNIIEPRFMGNKLNLSPLVILISLGFWGALWGVVGMLLSVPLMVIINIILAELPATRGLAILLSEKGEIQIESEHVIKNRKNLLKKVKNRLKVK